MRYENRTTTAIELVRGDIRDASEQLVLIGRNLELKAHYEHRCQRRFKTLPGLGAQFPVERVEAFDGSIRVLRTWLRPVSHTDQVAYESRRLGVSLIKPMAQAIRQYSAIGMVPISCRAPKATAQAMVWTIWTLSLATFLQLSDSDARSRTFTIYCDTDLQPFIDVLESGSYLSLGLSTVFGFELQCDRAKVARYKARDKFPFLSVPLP